MRGTVGVRLQSTNISIATRTTLVPFSTSSGGGRGRRGFAHFNVDERASVSSEPKSDATISPSYGRGGSFSGSSGQLPKSNTREPLIPSGCGGTFSASSHFNFNNEKAPGNPKSNEPKSESPIPPRGHGGGKPVPPPSGFPSFSSFMSSIKQPSTGRGRGFGPLPPQTVKQRYAPTS